MSDNPYNCNFFESKVPEYKLPSALLTEDGKKISSAFDWMNRQRAHILQLFEKHIYGNLPGRTDAMSFEVLNIKKDALDGLATRKEIRIHLMMNNGKKHYIDLLLYVPNNISIPVPAYVGLSFFGNQSCTNENDVLLSEQWMRPVDAAGIVDNKATEASRGYQAGRWPAKRIIERGYAMATMYCGDIYPDAAAKRNDSIYGLFDYECTGGAVSAWAWGLSRAMDYLENDPDICSSKVAVLGHSRLGKASLWAGAQDSRFAMVVSNDSGCGGAAISRRCFGERWEAILDMVPYWFCEKLQDYIDREPELPVDQHMLIALLAPRLVYIASAEEDLWADPKGEFLAGVNAAPVYNLFGSNGLGTDVMPELNKPVSEDIGYHIRPGVHNITLLDWEYFLDFSDKFFLSKELYND
jgi:(4-O-methyl)-D-glucuronate---lignin esterase